MAAATSASPLLTALITGANRGIGLGVAKALAQSGRFSQVLVTGRSKSALAAATATIQAIPGVLDGSVRSVVMDVSDQESVRAAAAGLRDEGVKLDVLVNNAAVLQYGDCWKETDYRSLMSVNVFGLLAVIESFSDLLNRDARVINVSSGWGQELHCPEPYQSELARAATVEEVKASVAKFHNVGTRKSGEAGTYKVSKRAVNVATRLLASDARFSDLGISFVAVCPGWVRTDMGGPSADRSVEQGAASITSMVFWDAKKVGAYPNGGFLRDGRPMAW
jgi:carbonyl reductase 1